MKTLLINGCSFGEVWKTSAEFVEAMDCDRLVNLSQGGISFQRTCRSTIEWIAQNGNPHVVLIPITFAHRWELALNQQEDDIDGSWIPLQNSNFIPEKYKLQDTSVDKVKKLVDLYYGINPTIKTFWDKMFMDIITFSAFLEKQKIQYLMWDMANGFDKEHLNIYSTPYKGFHKIKLIEENPRIIDIWTFCGNSYMRDTMPEDLRQKTPEFAYHHSPKQYRELEKYIMSYIDGMSQ
jgi:hypothetical protein